MPMTYAQHDKTLKVPAMCELFPLRDLPMGDNIMVRTNGAFVAGYELKGIQSYFATDDDRNRSKSQLEALLRGVPDVSMRIQFRYEISEHLGSLLDSYIDQGRAEQSEVMALDAHRLNMWREKEEGGYYFEPRLHVYYIWDPRIHAKLYHSAEQNRKLGAFTMGQKKVIQRLRKEHETFLAEFESLLRGVEGSMEVASLGPRRLSTQELFEALESSQHPTRRTYRSYIPGEETLEYRSAREQVTQSSILNETESYLNIDGYLYSVISLKELPDATFPGMLQKFSTLGFPVVVSGQVLVPDQVKVLKGYKKRLQKMTAAQKDANGNFKINAEAEVAQAQLLQVPATQGVRHRLSAQRLGRRTHPHLAKGPRAGSQWLCRCIQGRQQGARCPRQLRTHLSPRADATQHDSQLPAGADRTHPTRCLAQAPDKENR